MQENLASPALEEPFAMEELALQKILLAGCQPALTAREDALMQGLAAGYTNQQLARTFHRSEKTIRNQLTRLYQKLGVRNRTEAVAIYLRQGGG